MSCSTCGGKDYTPIINVESIPSTPKSKPGTPFIAGRSDHPEQKVRLRYYGGGLVRQTSGSGCVSCGGSRGYTMRTTETIQFVSDDAPGNMFKETFRIGHDYYVTEKQAEYLLKLEYYDRGGQVLKKFKKID